MTTPVRSIRVWVILSREGHVVDVAMHRGVPMLRVGDRVVRGSITLDPPKKKGKTK